VLRAHFLLLDEPAVDELARLVLVEVGPRGKRHHTPARRGHRRLAHGRHDSPNGASRSTCSGDCPRLRPLISMVARRTTASVTLRAYDIPAGTLYVMSGADRLAVLEQGPPGCAGHAEAARWGATTAPTSGAGA
jgi:hypothetical protein